MTRLTRRYRFSASHRLHAAPLSEAGNREVYGKCNNPFGHGHNYVLEIGVEGPVDPGSGRVVNVAALDGLVEREILQTLDRSDLNAEVPEFAVVVPTTENLALEIRRRLRAGWAGAFGETGPRLARIRIQETRRNIFEIMEEL
ncbi:MAG: 6-carboxytetrahydropterin synthase [Acidobacteriota bacterium]